MLFQYGNVVNTMQNLQKARQKYDNSSIGLSYQQRIRNSAIIKLVTHQMNELYSKTDFLNSLFCTKIKRDFFGVS